MRISWDEALDIIAEGGFDALNTTSLYNGNNPMYTFKYIALR